MTFCALIIFVPLKRTGPYRLINQPLKWAMAPSPGLQFFKALKLAFPNAKIIAEDLGEITPQVEELLDATGLPRMLVLQFASDGDSSNVYLPHNYSANSVVYSGTHDNDTSHGWFHSLNAPERDFYVNI